MDEIREQMSQLMTVIGQMKSGIVNDINTSLASVNTSIADVKKSVSGLKEAAASMRMDIQGAVAATRVAVGDVGEAAMKTDVVAEEAVTAMRAVVVAEEAATAMKTEVVAEEAVVAMRTDIIAEEAVVATRTDITAVEAVATRTDIIAEVKEDAVTTVRVDTSSAAVEVTKQAPERKRRAVCDVIVRDSASEIVQDVSDSAKSDREGQETRTVFRQCNQEGCLKRSYPVSVRKSGDTPLSSVPLKLKRGRLLKRMSLQREDASSSVYPIFRSAPAPCSSPFNQLDETVSQRCVHKDCEYARTSKRTSSGSATGRQSASNHELPTLFGNTGALLLGRRRSFSSSKQWDIVKGPGYSDQARKRIRVGTNFYCWRYDRGTACDAIVVPVGSPLMQPLPSSLCRAVMASWCLQYLCNEFLLVYGGRKILISYKELPVDCLMLEFRVCQENEVSQALKFPLIIKPVLKESQLKGVVDLNAIVRYIRGKTSQLSKAARVVLEVIVSHRPRNSSQLARFQVIEKSLGPMIGMCVEKMLEYDLGMDLRPLETSKLLPRPVIWYETQNVRDGIWDIRYSCLMSTGTFDRHFFVCLTECKDAALNKYSIAFCQASQSVRLMIRTPVFRARHRDNLETVEIFYRAGNRNADLILFVLDGCHPDDENKYRANIEYWIATQCVNKRVVESRMDNTDNEGDLVWLWNWKRLKGLCLGFRTSRNTRIEEPYRIGKFNDIVERLDSVKMTECN